MGYSSQTQMKSENVKEIFVS
ncbi:uncharacterized protein G2W53_019862 [Senna tora]|uniref:Uncharacterized protein n=1 Tax=Senna tora TaxID=362788 RepID=A0A834TV17_9FABA|nr:uncharacterized protein G2W53_019862 [Senna tora]